MQLKTLHRRKRKYILLILLICTAGMTKSYAQNEGLLNGIFSVNENVQVGFSKGNLQYQASTNTWRFADNQYDHIGSGNSNISSTYSGWIDLFGWGTSGYNHGAICYQPWSTSGNNSDYYAYGSYSYNLYDQTGLADWGKNSISNGGNVTNRWRTLSLEEWDYLLNTRSTTSGIRFAMANVNEVDGVILMPDNWNSSLYTLNNTNSEYASYSSNNISSIEWMNILEPAGVVFLPKNGYRWGTSWYGGRGDYWTSTHMDSNTAYGLYFYNGYLTLSTSHNRADAKAVRLIQVVQATSCSITTIADPVEGGTVTGGGTFNYGQTCTVIATPNDGYSFCSWTENGAVVSSSPTYTFTVLNDRNLMGNFVVGSVGELGYTVYDWQSNAAARTWTHIWPDGKVSFAFTHASNTSYSDRGTAIGTYDAINDVWISSGGRVESEKTGFGSIAQYGENGIVAVAHTAAQCGIYIIEDKDSITPCCASTVGYLDNTFTPMWPNVMTSGPNRNIIHVVATANGNTSVPNMENVIQPILYFRSQDGGQTWDKQNVVLPFMNADYGLSWGANCCYWMETTNDNCLALVVNNGWSDGMVIYSYDNGETWQRKVFYRHPNPFEASDEMFLCPRWTSCQWDSQHHLHVLYEFNGRIGEPGSGSYYPALGGVAYWNETMPYNETGTTQSAFVGNLTPGQPFVMDKDYLYNDIYASWWLFSDATHEMWPEYIGYLPALTNDGEVEPNPYNVQEFNIEDRSLHGSYNSGCVAMPVLCMVPGTDNMVAVWSAMDENHMDSHGNYFYKVFASYSNDGGMHWTNMVHLTNTPIYHYKEFVYLQAAVVDNKLIIAAQCDGETGSYVQSADNDPYDNYYVGLTFNMEELFGEDPSKYQIVATANPVESGAVTGSGNYAAGAVCVLTATPDGEFVFVNWTKNDSIVSTDATYSFIVTEDATYTAHFTRLLPELHVTNISHSTLVGGQQASISWWVRNDGTAATPNGVMWYDKVWLSPDSYVDANSNVSILLGTFENISALNVGEYYTQTHTFNIPIDISGDYYLFVITDADDACPINWENNEIPIPYNPPPYISCLSNGGNVVYELSEFKQGNGPGGSYNDNFFYELVDIAVPLVPDLQVSSIIAPDNFFSGTNVDVTATITNVGEVTTPNANWTDALYFSQEPDFNTAACLAMVAHSGALAVDSSYQVTFTGHIPLTVFGEAYFFVKTDIYEQVYEHINNHNNMTMSNPVNIILTPPADLEPSELVVPVAVSTAENLSYSFKVTNVGAGNPNVTSWVDKVYISTEDTFGANTILLNTHYHYGNLAPSAYYSINGSVSLPSNVNSGFYYVYVVTDATDAVFEYLYEDNNTIQSSQISVTSPDLQITEMTAPEQITSGYPINLSYTLINNGDGAIINRNITDRIFLSASGNLSNAFEIANMRHNVNLPVGQSMTVTCNATAPTNLTDGTFHLIVVADGNNEIHESNEGNNTLSQYPVPVMHQPLPDLQPVSLNLPSTIQAGEALNVDFDITNLGDLDLLNSNCTFNVYALQNGYEILCPVQSQTLPLGSNVSIGIGQTVHFVRSVLVPASVTSACTTFKLYADKENRVTESNENNNTITANTSVIDCPLPDLTVSSFTLPAIQAGTEAQVSFSVSNQGTADFNGSFGTAVYANASGTQILCPLRQQIAPETTNYSLAVGESLQFSLKVLVPPTVTSACNSFSVKVDEANAVLETNENNNSVNGSASVTNYPFNLTTQNFVVPSTITAGESTSVSWTVKNTGTCPNGQIPFYIRNGGGYALVEGEYLPTPWKDRIYLSDDASLSNNDIQLLADDHNTVLHPNGTYSVEQTVTLPYSAVGLKYLLCVSDATELTFDNNRSDNVVVVPITVELGTLPDLHLTALTVEPVMTSDNAYWVQYTVTNEGERVTQRDNWMDAFYIGQTYAVAGAFQLGSKIHNGALEEGASYTDSIEIVLPSGLNSDYFLLGYTDATNLVFENTNESNNLHGVTVTVVAPDPCDLIAIQPEFPNYAVSGEEMTVSWQLRNIGANPAVGRVRNAVYLSTDADWSSDDVMLGYANVDINIAANQQQACSLSGSLTGIAEGNYYVIVKANILNALNESSYENNICASLLTTEVGFPTLAIGEQVDRSMTSDQYIYYKLEVGPEYEGQTLSCTLTTMEQQVANGLYLSHETVPTLSQYNFGRYAPYAQEIEILIPALEQGDYYLLAKGSTQNGSPQQVSIATSIINFEILHIDADHGSNTGSITTKVTGAKFDSIMDFRLVQGGEYLPAEKVFFSNSTETYTTFDLVDMPAGTYAMEAELPGGIITIKGEAFTIEEGLPAELAVNIVAPSSVRRGNTFPVNIEYGNIGTTDLNVSGFVVVSRNGHPIGFTSDELAEGLTERVFSTAEANGNPDVLRPGYRATKTILVDANTLTSVSLQVYAIRKQY